MAGILDANKLLAAKLRKSIKERKVEVPAPPKNPKNRKRKWTPTVAPDDTIPPSPEKADDENAVLAREVEELFHSDAPFEPFEAPRDDQPEVIYQRLPAGSDRPFTQLSASEKNRRINRSFGALYSDTDDKMLKELGKTEVDLLHESWLDFSIRMHAVARHYYSSSSEEVSKLKEELATLRTTLAAAEEGRDRALDLVSQAETSKQQLVADHQKEVESLTKDIQELEGRLKAKEEEAHKLKQDLDGKEKYVKELKRDYNSANRRAEDSETKRLQERSAIIEEWKQSTSGQSFFAEVGVESHEIGSTEAQKKMKAAIELVCADKLEQIEAEFKRLEKEERDKAMAEMGLNSDSEEVEAEAENKEVEEDEDTETSEEVSVEEGEENRSKASQDVLNSSSHLDALAQKDDERTPSVGPAD